MKYLILALILWTFLADAKTVNPTQLCVLVRENRGEWYPKRLRDNFDKFQTSEDFQWGHTMLLHVAADKSLTTIESPGKIRTAKSASERLLEFAGYADSDAPVAGTCYPLSAEDEERIQARVVGEKLVETIEKIKGFHEITNNCTHFSEGFFEEVTGNNLKVRGMEHVFIASPNVLRKNLSSRTHSFQNNKPGAVTLQETAAVLDYISLRISNSPDSTPEFTDESTRLIEDIKKSIGADKNYNF